MSESPVLIDVENAVATLTLNRPDAANAVDLPLAHALLQAALRCDNDPAIRCVVIASTGKFFCPGGDIAAFAAAGETVSAFLSELAGTLHMAVTRLMRMRKPLITLVNGPAAGAGLSLALSGDYVLAAPTAHFTAAYTAVGLTPDGGLSWLLPRLVGMRRAQDMLIANRRVTAAEGVEIGLISRVVEADALASEGAALAATLATSATQAIGGVRALLLESHGASFEGQLEREVRSISAAGGSAECREGVSAFLGRRKPDFVAAADA